MKLHLILVFSALSLANGQRARQTVYENKPENPGIFKALVGDVLNGLKAK